MKPCIALVPWLFIGAAVAQDPVPIPLSKDGAAICRANGGDAPNCITPPHPTYAPDPKYPKKSRKGHDRGTVLLKVVVGTDGLPRDIEIEHGLTPELEKSAIDAVKQWKFVPAARSGQPIAVLIHVEVNFHLY